MGFLLKSTMGLGAVYFAMFGQALQSSDLAPRGSVCASAASAAVSRDSGLGARLQAASCAAALAAEAEGLNAPLKAATSLTPPLRAPLPPTAKASVGTLTQADLSAPWFGPSRIPRKIAARG